MYLSHFGLDEAPYRITPHTDFFFGGANRGATLEALIYAITNDEGIVKVTGEVGSGKTMLCRVLIERLPANVETIYLANPSLDRDEIVLAILDDLKVPSGGQRSTVILRALQDHLIARYAEGKRVVILIDEAHAMPVDTLEEVRLLSNLESKRHKLLQIVLFGQQELDAILGTPHMRPLKERIVHSFGLEPLVRSDIGNYLMFRMRQAGYKGPDIFSSGAVRLISRTSQGLTRRVNILADKALLAAFAEGGHEILPRHVKAAITDSEFSRLGATRFRMSGRTGMALAAGSALAALAVVGLPRVLQETRNAPVPVGAPELAAAIVRPPSVPVQPSPAPAQVPEAAPGATLPTSSAAPAPLAAPRATPLATPAPTLLAIRRQATRDWLLEAPDSTFTVSLITMDAARPDEANTWLERLPPTIDRSRIYVYPSKINGEQRLRVVYGSYPTLSAASAAIQQLPESLASVNPGSRAVASIRAELRAM